MAFSTFGRSRKSHDAAHMLNLTPMIDVMVIILIFLVKSYSVTPQYLTPAKDLKLAAITSDVSAPDNATLVVGMDGIRIDDQVVVNFAQLKASAFSEASWPELERKLRQLQKDKKFKGSDVLILQADRGLAFDYLKPVIRTAGAAGFKDIKFAGSFED